MNRGWGVLWALKRILFFNKDFASLIAHSLKYWDWWFARRKLRLLARSQKRKFACLYIIVRRVGRIDVRKHCILAPLSTRSHRQMFQRTCDSKSFSINIHGALVKWRFKKRKSRKSRTCKTSCVLVPRRSRVKWTSGHTRHRSTANSHHMFRRNLFRYARPTNFHKGERSLFPGMAIVEFPGILVSPFPCPTPPAKR